MGGLCEKKCCGIGRGVENRGSGDEAGPVMEEKKIED